MLNKSKVIVLSKLKYRDNDLIVKCFTLHRGVVSYLLKGVLNTKKGSSKVAYYQLLSQLQIEENYRQTQSLQFIKDVRLDYNYRTLHTNLFKGSIVMFLSEVLSSVLREEEENQPLYHYLETTFRWLDTKDEFSNFHLLFLLNLTKHLGFYPDISDTNQLYFNLNNGLFESKKEEVYSVSGENLTILKQLLGTNFDALDGIKLNSKQRQSFLSMLLLYFELHLGSFRKPKSLKIFNQIFN
ncbi:DNA repair protein RecO [Psychroserpens sp.]|jgi:DNA repair protein RecO (recombination protein O)|uniref:DNA repair protein RecO n=1 Tax=Psychroserpens sp. TaxID=2020870 RepID=UPI0039E2EBE9